MKCQNCNETILPCEAYYVCKEHQILYCEKCADRSQRACPIDKDPLEVNVVSY